MPSRKQEKRRRKLRVHGPSSDSVGAPPAGRKEPRPDGPARSSQSSRARRAPAVPSLRRSMRKGALLAVLMLVVILVTSKSRGAVWYALTVFEVLVLLVLFVFLDLWVTRKVYKKVTGQDPPAA